MPSMPSTLGPERYFGFLRIYTQTGAYEVKVPSRPALRRFWPYCEMPPLDEPGPEGWIAVSIHVLERGDGCLRVGEREIAGIFY